MDYDEDGLLQGEVRDYQSRSTSISEAFPDTESDGYFSDYSLYMFLATDFDLTKTYARRKVVFASNSEDHYFSDISIGDSFSVYVSFSNSSKEIGRPDFEEAFSVEWRSSFGGSEFKRIGLFGFAFLVFLLF
jgi:hypothetical protein